MHINVDVACDKKQFRPLLSLEIPIQLQTEQLTWQFCRYLALTRLFKNHINLWKTSSIVRKWWECLSLQSGSKEDLNFTYVNSMLQRRGTGRWRGLVMVEYFRKWGSLWKAIQTTPTTNKSQDSIPPLPPQTKRQSPAVTDGGIVGSSKSLCSTCGSVSTWMIFMIEHPKIVQFLPGF